MAEQLAPGARDAASAPRVLVVEDDATLQAVMVHACEREGMRVEAVDDVPGALASADGFRPDLALIDVGLPGSLSGFDLAEQLRAKGGTSLLFVTAADALDDRLRGFELGADDYVVKPFAVAELLARVKAVLRRTGRLVSTTIEVRDLVLDETTRQALRAGVPIALTPLEFDLLVILAKSPGRVFSKRQLLALVWGFTDFDPNLVEVHVSALRRKLEAHGPRMIHTARNAGYVLRA
jgi:DNA-binding response OmpR family regulator